jgi:WD40 repeat protein
MDRRVDFLPNSTIYSQSERLIVQHSGIISALSFAPDGSGTFAAGSYSGTISIYSEDSGEDRLAEIFLGEPSSGITQVGFGLQHLYTNLEDTDRLSLAHVSSVKRSHPLGGIQDV